MKSTKMAERVTAKNGGKTFGNVLLVAKRVPGYSLKTISNRVFCDDRQDFLTFFRDVSLLVDTFNANE